MLNAKRPEPIDYLVIGHLTSDVTPAGNLLGGTVSFSSLTAEAMDQRVGIVTALGGDIDIKQLGHLPIAGVETDQSTTFENIATPEGRVQILHNIAPTIRPHHIPKTWLRVPVLHLGPLVHEIDLDILQLFPNSFIGATIQGWLREWNREGVVRPSEWPEASYVLSKLDAVVLSFDDVDRSQERIAEMASVCPLLVVTDGARGATLYQDGESVPVPAPMNEEVDAVGAGDIFAAAFFIHYKHTQDAIGAIELANQLASNSVSRIGLDGIPTKAEVRDSLYSRVF